MMKKLDVKKSNYFFQEYNAAVLQGSTISVTNLAPRLVIRSRFSIGVGVMTPFSEDSHPEGKYLKTKYPFSLSNLE